MTRLLSILFLSLYLLLVFRPLLPYVEYAMFKEYIAEVLCINKDKPEMNCCGKCHLKKRVEDQQKADQPHQNSSKTKDNLITQNYIASFFKMQFTQENILISYPSVQWVISSRTDKPLTPPPQA